MVHLLSLQDAEGRAPVHVAISNQHSVIIQLLISHPDIHLSVRDRQGLTPFACAMTYKNNRAAEAILKRESGAAEQVRDPHPTLRPVPELGGPATRRLTDVPSQTGLLSMKTPVLKVLSPFLKSSRSGRLSVLAESGVLCPVSAPCWCLAHREAGVARPRQGHSSAVCLDGVLLCLCLVSVSQ